MRPISKPRVRRVPHALSILPPPPPSTSTTTQSFWVSAVQGDLSPDLISGVPSPWAYLGSRPPSPPPPPSPPSRTPGTRPCRGSPKYLGVPGIPIVRGPQTHLPSPSRPSTHRNPDRPPRTSVPPVPSHLPLTSTLGRDSSRPDRTPILLPQDPTTRPGGESHYPSGFLSRDPGSFFTVPFWSLVLESKPLLPSSTGVWGGGCQRPVSLGSRLRGRPGEGQ